MFICSMFPLPVLLLVSKELDLILVLAPLVLTTKLVSKNARSPSDWRLRYSTVHCVCCRWVERSTDTAADEQGSGSQESLRWWCPTISQIKYISEMTSSVLIDWSS